MVSGAPRTTRGAPILGSANRLLNRKTSNSLHGNPDCRNDLSQLIERTGLWLSRRHATAFIVSDMMNYEITPEILKPSCSRDHVFRREIVSHDLQAKILSSLDYHLDCLRMGPLHNHDMGSSGFCHHLGLKPTTIHDFQVSDNGNIRKLGAQSANAINSLGDDQWRARLQPVNPRAQGESCGFESFGDGDEV